MFKKKTKNINMSNDVDLVMCSPTSFGEQN